MYLHGDELKMMMISMLFSLNLMPWPQQEWELKHLRSHLLLHVGDA